MKLNVAQVNSSVFMHFPKTKSLVAAISDIGIRSFQPPYDDAADVGFALRNEKTGNVTRWALSETLRDPAEGEIIGWKMIPTTESVRSNPQMEGYTIHLLND